MPESTVGFGHDAHGVNIQNLRTLTDGAVKRLPGGFRSVHDWKRETQEALALAGHENFMSRSLRNASKRLEDQLKLKSERDQAKVDKALKCKIGKTEHLKGILETCVDGTRDEKVRLTAARNRMQRKAKKALQQLALTEARSKLRFERPTREKVNDTVQLQLQKQEGLLQAYISGLQHGLKAAEVGIARLGKSLSKLASDLHDKVAALELDTMALEGDFAHERVPNTFLQGAQGLHPHHWNRSTEELVKEANKWIADSARLRHEVQKLMDEKDAAASECCKDLNLAMVEKLNETDDMKQLLMEKLTDTTKEIEGAKQRRLALEAALEEKKVPTQQAMRRLLMRKQRPCRERVDDEAHQALITELRNLTSMSTQLREKIAAVNSEIRHLEDKAQLVDENLKDKDSSWKVDEQCIMLDGRVNSSRPPSSVGSGSVVSKRSLSSSVSIRSDILSRIQHLENELTKARTERIGMETTVQKLQEESDKQDCV
ncbi:hypothetical protein BSKO_02558 [Bryopsis sp. KO-2023]|nr:hypothetical protein BSKO_02558 [Bryopsis sp. KO-2023]